MTTSLSQPEELSPPQVLTVWYRWKKPILLVLGLLLAGGAYLGFRYFAKEEGRAMTSTPVKQGEFVISLKLKNGELEAVKAEQITAPEVRGQLKIVQLWPEGEHVDVGNLVVQFDQADFQKRVTEAEQALEQAKAELEKTLANQKVEISRLEADIENQKASLRLAQLQVEKMKFEASVQKQEAEISAQKSDLALQQAEKKLEGQKVVDNADRKKGELEIAQKERELERAKKDFESLSVKAEKPGIVVYEKVWKSGRMEKVRVGDQPWGGQKLISLPDLTRMQVKVVANEVDVDKLKVGQKALIKLDALTEPTFHGAITSIATLGHEKEDEKNVKVFDILLSIEEEDTRLKPGMTATSEVIVETIPEPAKPPAADSVLQTTPEVQASAPLPLYVPLDAVFEKDGQTVVYRLKNGKPEEQVVKLGKKNENYVIVEEGLGPDDRITLRNPTLTTQDIGGLEGEGKKPEQGVKVQ